MFPKKAPIKVTKVSAKDAPINTGIGLLFWVTSVNTANCVLSPNSAKNNMQKDDKTTFQSILRHPLYQLYSISVLLYSVHTYFISI